MQKGGEGGEAPPQETEGAQGPLLQGGRQGRGVRKQATSLPSLAMFTSQKLVSTHRSHRPHESHDRSATFSFALAPVFAWTGFVKKLEPNKPRSRDLQTTRHAMLCKFCDEAPANRNQPFHEVCECRPVVTVLDSSACFTLTCAFEHHYRKSCTPPPPRSTTTSTTARTSPSTSGLACSTISEATKQA